MKDASFLDPSGRRRGACGSRGAAIWQVPQIRWRMSTSWPKSLDTMYGSASTCQAGGRN